MFLSVRAFGAETAWLCDAWMGWCAGMCPIPVTVKALGTAWVVKNPVASGAVIQAGDLVQAEVDWAEESAPVLADIAAWQGQVATRPLTTGQTLRQGMVKAAQVFQAGAQVRVVAQGAGFQVSGDAQALQQRDWTVGPGPNGQRTHRIRRCAGCSYSTN